MNVRWLQESLNTVLELEPDKKLAVDGDYGPLTEAAVVEFQERNNLIVDGFADLLTEIKIRERLDAGRS